jgi:NAD(P)-dependent dehydrogenase (short-subunit alcohol dehydrogenase family)
MSKTAVITGANRGIGLEFCKAYMAQGYTVIAVCRTPSDALSELGCKVVSGVDVSLPEQVNTLKAAIGDTPIDILINNAGVFSNESFVVGEANSLDFNSIEYQMNINAYGPLRVTQALAGNLSLAAKQNGIAKVGMITSRMGSIADNTSGAYYGYRASKAALNAFSKSLACDLKSDDIAVAILHPGFVQTEMVGFNGDISPIEAASRLIKRVDGLDMSNTGTFWHSNGDLLPW